MNYNKSKSALSKMNNSSNKTSANQLSDINKLKSNDGFNNLNNIRATSNASNLQMIKEKSRSSNNQKPAEKLSYLNPNSNNLRSKENLPANKVILKDVEIKQVSPSSKENELPNSAKKRQIEENFVTNKFLKANNIQKEIKKKNSFEEEYDNIFNGNYNWDFDVPINDELDDSSISEFKYNDISLLNNTFDNLPEDFFNDPIDDTTEICTFEGFYGLPNDVKRLFEEERKIKNLYPWQDELMKKLVNHNSNLVYCVPTSGGKTLVAELMILREILLNKKNALFIFPYVSIVREKLRSLIVFALDLGFVIEEYANEKGQIPLRKRKNKNVLYIATIEKAHLILTSLLEEKRLNELGLIVVDELHMLGDGSVRGCTLESLLVLVMLAKERKLLNARLIAMSATLSNFKDISRFLNAKIEERNFRPVQLNEYVKHNQRIYKYSAKKEKETDDCFKEDRIIKEGKKTDPDNLTELVEECIPENPVLIFCSTKHNCESVVKLICDHLPNNLKRFKEEQRQKIISDIKESNSGEICKVLKIGIPFGVVYHHSGLTTEEREIIESNFLEGNLSVIVCTSTLAAGVNLPAQRVIIRAPYVARFPLSVSQYKQMIGRAGRAGFNDDKPGESILMIKDADKDWIRSLFGNAENNCISSINSNKEAGISRIFLSLFHLGLAENLDEVRNVFSKKTLYGIQFCKEENFSDQLDSLMARFFDLNLIKKPLTNQAKFEITSLGKAAVKSLFDINKCAKLFIDLKKLSKRVSVNSNFHLFYICTHVFDLDELPTKPSSSYLQDTFMKLTADEKEDAEEMGIKERQVFDYLHYSNATTIDEKIRRFFFALLIYQSWKLKEPISALSSKCEIQKGTLQRLFSHFSNNVLSLYRFVSEIKELSGLRKLIEDVCSEISLCASPELVPLLELPYVKIARAKLLHKNDFKSLEDIAAAKPEDIFKAIEKISMKECADMIKFSKQYFKDKSDILKVDTDYYSQLGE